MTLRVDVVIDGAHLDQTERKMLFGVGSSLEKKWNREIAPKLKENSELQGEIRVQYILTGSTPLQKFLDDRVYQSVLRNREESQTAKHHILIILLKKTAVDDEIAKLLTRMVQSGTDLSIYYEELEGADILDRGIRQRKQGFVQAVSMNNEADFKLIFQDTSSCIDKAFARYLENPNEALKAPQAPREEDKTVISSSKTTAVNPRIPSVGQTEPNQYSHDETSRNPRVSIPDEPRQQVSRETPAPTERYSQARTHSERPITESSQARRQGTPPASPPASRSNPYAKIKDLMLKEKLLQDADYYFYEPRETRYAYPMDVTAIQSGVRFGGVSWAMAGASRRGYKHWHEALHRDDAFALGCQGAWHVIAMADGAGSAAFSRETANRSVQKAKTVICNYAPAIGELRDLRKIEDRLHGAMEQAVREAYNEHISFTKDNNLTAKDTHATFLLFVHHALEDGTSVVGTFQVGDGYMLAAKGNQSLRLEKGDYGADRVSTHFMQSFSLDELLHKINVEHHSVPYDFWMLMTDGIEDDFLPTAEELTSGLTHDKKIAEIVVGAIRNDLQWPCHKDWAELIDHTISYYGGSFDDRTLAVLASYDAQKEDCR